MCHYDPRCACSYDDLDTDFVGHVLRFIAEGRWGITGVYGCQFSAPFAYTTGLTGLGRPELVMTGLEPELAGRLLNNVADRLVHTPGLGAGARLPRVIRDHDVALVEVIDPAGIAEQIATLAVYGAVRSLQVVWPDSRGRFPWSVGYDLPAASQPLWGAPTGGKGVE